MIQSQLIGDGVQTEVAAEPDVGVQGMCVLVQTLASTRR